MFDRSKSDIHIFQLCALRPEDSVGMGCVGSQFPGRSGSDPCEQRGQLQYCGRVRRPTAVGNKSVRMQFSPAERSTNLVVEATSLVKKVEVYGYCVSIY